MSPYLPVARLGKGEKTMAGSGLVKQIVSQVGLRKNNSKFSDRRKSKRKLYLGVLIKAHIFMNNTLMYIIQILKIQKDVQ